VPLRGSAVATAHAAAKRPVQSLENKWSGRVDLNHRPPGPEPDPRDYWKLLESVGRNSFALNLLRLVGRSELNFVPAGSSRSHEIAHTAGMSDAAFRPVVLRSTFQFVDRREVFPRLIGLRRKKRRPRTVHVLGNYPNCPVALRIASTRARRSDPKYQGATN